MAAKSHGLSGQLFYNSWSGMMSRCYSVTSKDYIDYGGRGIMVCERWLSVENFYEDMGDRGLGESIERLDNNLDYTPENCVWAKPHAQTRNRRTNHWVEMEDGRTVCITDAAAELGLTRTALLFRLKTSGKVFATRSQLENARSA